MKKNFFLININEKILILFLALFSLLINQYYGNRGIFPVDSFSHFDSGFRILLGEYPFKDFWVVSGPLVDYLQAIFFYCFGVNWQSYILHASLFNAILTVATFFILRNFNLNLYLSFLYALLFSILAYPSSGTPFVDHHAAFFSLLGVYCLILGIKNEKKIYWILLPIFLICAFFSKQVPSSYVIISIIFILIYFSFSQKKFYWIKYFFGSGISLVFLLIIFGSIQGIHLSSFLEQYIFYPQTIKEQRMQNFDLTFRGLINHFKFIYIALAPLFYVNLKNIFYNKNYFKDKNFCYFLIILLFTFSLIFHQTLTKNQTFIFFLIPILIGFSSIFLDKLDFKKFINIFLIFICLGATLKYHLRFNEGRKFHELNYVDFKLSYKGSEIDKKFNGLKWITPKYRNNVKEEIELVKQAKLHLKDDNRTKMLITNYSFFSALLNEKLFSPSRWHLSDGTDYPLKGNKYFNSYKNLIINLIKNNNITVIYTIYPIESSVIYTYLDKSCLSEKKVSNTIHSYEIKSCYEING